MSCKLTALSIGFIPLTDAAPLVVAKEYGLFEKWHLSVELKKQNSWATLRDKLLAGVLDAAHMLAPMPLASTLGCGGQKDDLLAPLVLSRNGNAITWSIDLYQEVLEANQLAELTLPVGAQLLRAVIEQRKQQGLAKLRFADVFPFSGHHYQLYQWLLQGGIALEEVELLTIPPVNMVSFLERGDIDGFCVGGPWNAKAVRSGSGMTCVTSYDIWPDMPEKVLGVREVFAETNEQTITHLCAALLEACAWLEHTPNRFEAARLLTRPEYLDSELEVIAPSLIGSCLTHSNLSPRSIPRYNLFSDASSRRVNAPDKAFGRFLVEQMFATGQLRAESGAATAADYVFDDRYFELAIRAIANQQSA